ncbi:M3 family metallopeptidase [Paraburkholderia phenazinium]|uniref:Peptidase family M3 n=1 Tax=Paraburkholderia phenazinium TaxID=60549 RepID=A0A1G8IMN4_9BURK|nr:M3 family metallopeptidase [Paraburkholderia phenazinium]SDI20051.1 Peptidase family M3 [Paraburkholderia phenazinium]
MKNARFFFDQLNQDYLQIHRKEWDLFWLTHTGQSDDHEAQGAAGLARRTFLADAQRLGQSREHLATVEAAEPFAERDALMTGLRGWVAAFEGNAIGSERAAALLAELIAMDADLFARRQAYKMHHIGVSGRSEEASPAVLRQNLASNPDEASRRSSHDALHGLERWVLENGFLDIVAKRNALARELGYRDFFDYRLRTYSGVSPEQLFEVFDEFERNTRDAHSASLDRLATEYGEESLQPQNLSYRMRGDAAQTTDAYFPFGKALQRWAESFRRLGVSYRGARIQIDLLDRPGKFPTGFCVSPTASYHDDNTGWVPADVRFTSTARPRQAGAGLQGLNVLFHEAGHAAHFSNVALNAPCFSHIFAPSSPAYLEAQAKFFDALPGDPCWIKRYARNAAGEPMPDDMIRARVESNQIFLAYNERRDLVPTYFERALYGMEDGERTVESVLELARSLTQRILGVPHHTGYVLSMPHPIYHDMAVYYQGYLLAKMAASQTRAYLMRSLGYIVDNPAVGPLLAQRCWASGNSLSLDRTLRNLTGEDLNSSYLAAECNRSPEEAWARAQDAIKRTDSAAPPIEAQGDLDASISIVDGAQCIATNEESLPAMYAAFEAWIEGDAWQNRT